MLHERDLSAGVALLLEPCEPEDMRLQRGDDVVELVAIDVVDAHLGAAGRAAAVLTAERPRDDTSTFRSRPSRAAPTIRTR